MKFLQVIGGLLAILGLLLLVAAWIGRVSYNPYRLEVASMNISVTSLVEAANTVFLLAILAKLFGKKTG